MKRELNLPNFIAQETKAFGGFAMAEGWNISIIEELLPSGLLFPKIFQELYNQYSFSSFESTPVTFLGNEEDDSGEIYEYFNENKEFISECCELGYLPFARCISGSYDPICFNLQGTKSNKRDYPIVRLDHEQILLFKNKITTESISKSMYQFMRNKIES